MLIKTLLSIFLLMTLSQKSYSDDAYVDVLSGTVKLMSDHPSIRMVGEDVKIITNSTSTYDVDATFVFYNEEKSTTVLVGFPMHGYSPEGDTVGEFISFKTFVNEKEVPVINQYKYFREEKPTDEKWKIKEVSFPKGQEVITRVQYTAPYGFASNGDAFIDYIIGTGKSWSGNIGISTFTVIFTDDTNLSVNDPFSLLQYLYGKSRFSRTKNTMSWVTPEFKPEYIRDMFHVEIAPFWTPYRDIVPNLDTFGGNPVDPLLLEKLTVKQLRILRNAVYARHGKIFKDKELAKYFSTRQWYAPKQDYVEGDLSDIEKDNIQRIAEYEKYLMSLPK